MNNVVIASSNPGKLAEFQALLAPKICVSQKDLGIGSPEETACTFIENALIKARHVAQITGQPALADDSGLVVNALNGRPGILSARYADSLGSEKDNIQCLLEEMQNIDRDRSAYFFCCIVLLRFAEDPSPLIAYGRLSGLIAQKASGTKGFGYDPVFYLPDYQCTVAELAPEIKNQISHRAIAMAKLKLQLAELYG